MTEAWDYNCTAKTACIFLALLRLGIIFNKKLLSVYGRVILKQIFPEFQEVYKYMEIF